MAPSDIWQIVILIMLIGLSAFFSSAETALTSVNKIRIRSLADEGVKKAKTVSLLVDDPTKMLGAILIGNNIVNLTASSMATTFAIELCNKMGMGNNASIGVGIATGIVTIVILIFGEITPKSLATLHSEKLSLSYSGIIFFLTQLLTPVIFIVNKLAMGLLFLLRVDATKSDSAITESELRTIVDFSHEEGVIEYEERKMITNVVDFGDSFAKDVMVPHIDMECVEAGLGYDELMHVFEENKFSRLPVYEDSRDNVIGIINLKDVFFYKGNQEDFDIRGLIREPYYTYEFQKTSQLMVELRKASCSVAIVLDEYGSTVGLITLEDLLEEIVGEIRDEYDMDEVDPIQKINEHEFMIEGTARLDEVNEFTGLSLESDDYDSIAGHVISLLEHLPKHGESITDGNVVYVVKEIHKNRVDKVFIKILPVEEEDKGE